ncbi:MurR/RpiR family transcriptional regulator [Mycobacterium sp. Root135]|uniref:MurR/RpiR family transcriptional regulator n=1 Tax=Mycobacterium sp. Root135 TaxID=1736457 RepID=UPI000B301D83|nr:MurR/RpiR family transcriptional regulator [Mycobacterium sp. Root135]
MSFRAVVASSQVKLSASEDRVMNVLLGADMSHVPAAEVAEKAQTHESTVIRLAKKLGYRGYPELRSDLRRDEGGAPSSSAPPMRSESGHHLDEFIRDEVAAMNSLSRFVSQEDLDAAARTLNTTRTVYLLSSNDERPTMELLARRLRRLGLTVVSLRPSPKDLAERFVSFDHTSTLIGFALREAPKQLSTLMGEATRRGGKTILISDVPGYKFRPSPDHLLAARRGDDSEYRTQLIPIALCYALQLAVFHLDADRYQATRDSIDDLTRMLGGTGEIPLRP